MLDIFKEDVKQNYSVVNNWIQEKREREREMALEIN